MSTEFRAVPHFSCSSNFCLQQGSRSTFTFCSLFQRSCCAGTCSRFVLGQLVRPFFLFDWCNTTVLFSSPLWSQRSYVSGMLSYRLPVLCPAGKIDRLPCFGTYDASRVHTPMPSSPYVIKASIFVLLKIFLSLLIFSELCRSF